MGLKIKIIGNNKEDCLQNLGKALNIASMIARHGVCPEAKDVWWVRKKDIYFLKPPLGEQDTHTARVIDESDVHITLEFFYIWDSVHHQQYTFNIVSTYAVYHSLIGAEIIKWY